MKKTLLILAAMLLCVVATGAGVPIGTLSGTVLDAHGRIVYDAAVMIQTSDGLQPYATHTDRSGHFEINRLEIGMYDLRASSNGFISDWTRRVRVRPNKTTEVLLHLPPPRG
jgi:hypothetical protein